MLNIAQLMSSFFNIIMIHLICSHDVSSCIIVREETSSRWRKKQLLPRGNYNFVYCSTAVMYLVNIIGNL